MSIGFKGANNASKILAVAAIRVLENPDLRQAAIAEHRANIGEDFHYEALLGDRDPPLDYRK